MASENKEFDWVVTQSKHIVKDRWISLRADTCRMPNGKIVAPYYVLEYPDWINVVAITKQHEVVLVQQYRHGSGQTLLELPSGCVETADTSPLEAARRELAEETGYSSDNFIQTSVVSPNPSNHSNLTYSFLALDVERKEQIHLDSTEQINVVLMPLDEVIAKVKENQFLQAMHVSSLFYALIHLGIIRL